MKQLYKKHNSFIDLKIKRKSDINIFLNNLKKILEDKNNLLDLGNYYIDIIEKVVLLFNHHLPNF